jgi:hypothetical protein
MNTVKPLRLLSTKRDARTILRHTQQRSTRQLHTYLLLKVQRTPR